MNVGNSSNVQGRSASSARSGPPFFALFLVALVVVVIHLLIKFSLFKRDLSY